MPRGRKTGKIKDKWRDKTWVQVNAPQSFGRTPIAFIPITDPQKANTRVIETTLYDLVKQDPQQYAVKLYFQITRLVDDVAETILKVHEYSREYLRSLVRRGAATVNLVKDYTTKDSFKVRVYVVAFTQSRINSSRKHAIRQLADKVLTEKAQNLNYDQFCQEVVLEKMASDIYNAAKKVCNLRRVGVRKLKLIQVGKAEAEVVEAVAA